MQALLGELGDAVFLDVFLTLEIELLLDLDLDRQAMRVPPGLPLDEETPHRLVAADGVLHGARENVMRSRMTVRRGRTLEEDEPRGVRTLLRAPAEGVVTIPELEDFLLDVR